MFKTLYTGPLAGLDGLKIANNNMLKYCFLKQHLLCTLHAIMSRGPEIEIRQPFSLSKGNVNDLKSPKYPALYNEIAVAESSISVSYGINTLKQCVRETLATSHYRSSKNRCALPLSMCCDVIPQFLLFLDCDVANVVLTHRHKLQSFIRYSCAKRRRRK